MKSSELVVWTICVTTLLSQPQGVQLSTFALLSKSKLTASDGAAEDYFGCAVAIGGDLAIIGAYNDDDKGSNSGGAYVYRSYDGGDSWSFLQKLTAPDGGSYDYFGRSVAISGSTAIVGAYRDDDKGTSSGSAYIYWSADGGASWTFRQKLAAFDGANSDYFGYAIAISGNLAIIGGYRDDDKGSGSGSAYMYRSMDVGASWSFQQKLTAFDGASYDEFGSAVAISGSLVLVGAHQNNAKGSRSGGAYIYRSADGGASWSFQQKLTAFDGAAEDRFGYSVAISSNLAIVGAFRNDDKGTNSGSAYLYRSTDGGSSWTFQQKLLAADGATEDRFGSSVAISSNLAIVGALWDDDKGSKSGSAYMYRSADGGVSWAFQQKLLAPDGAVEDRFGRFVDISGDAAIVGSCFDDDRGTDSGSAYIFNFENSEEASAWPTAAPTPTPSSAPTQTPTPFYFEDGLCDLPGHYSRWPDDACEPCAAGSYDSMGVVPGKRPVWVCALCPIGRHANGSEVYVPSSVNSFPMPLLYETFLFGPPFFKKWYGERGDAFAHFDCFPFVDERCNDSG
eukprot:scaffold1465_cov148-Pinguiococcus_pyrenoidosus.AAC.2